MRRCLTASLLLPLVACVLLPREVKGMWYTEQIISSSFLPPLLCLASFHAFSLFSSFCFFLILFYLFFRYLSASLPHKNGMHSLLQDPAQAGPRTDRQTTRRIQNLISVTTATVCILEELCIQQVAIIQEAVLTTLRVQGVDIPGQPVSFASHYLIRIISSWHSLWWKPAGSWFVDL